MNQDIRFSDLTPTGSARNMNTRYNTHIVSADGVWDWKPIEVKTPNTWVNLARRARGEA